MIELYTWATPNGRKASIALEEMGLAFEVRPVDLTKGDQRKPEFLAISPMGAIPAIVDADGPGGQPIRLFDSAAILLYLADKTGKLLPTDLRGRAAATAWLMTAGELATLLQMFRNLLAGGERRGAVGLRRRAEGILGALDARLAGAEFVADGYSIADIAFYPFVEAAAARTSGLVRDEHAHLRRWLADVGGRPAVQRGMAVPADAA